MENRNRTRTKFQKKEEEEDQNNYNQISNRLLALTLPTHLTTRIFSQLDCIDLLQCSLVCKQWYKDTTELREGWKNEYIEAYNRLGLSIKRETHRPSSTCSIRGLHSWCP